ncbi:MAG: DNA binding protein, partial [Tremellales sp. Tagirdzhanova-0007]
MWLRNLLPEDAFKAGSLKNPDPQSIDIAQSQSSQSQSQGSQSGESLKLMLIDPEKSQNGFKLQETIDKGVMDALRRGYLKSLMLVIFLDEAQPDDIIESYTFNFSYTGGEVVSVSHSMSQLGLGHSGSDQVSCSASAHQSVGDVTQAIRRMTRTFVISCQTLTNLPKQCFVDLKLFYTDETPETYHPPLFTDSSEDDRLVLRTRRANEQPRHIPTGHLETGHHGLSIRILSVADCIMNDRDALLAASGTVKQLANVDENRERDIIWEAESAVMERRELESALARTTGVVQSRSVSQGNFLEHPIGQRVGNRLVPIPKGIIRLDLDDPESLGVRGSKTERSCRLDLRSRKNVYSQESGTKQLEDSQIRTDVNHSQRSTSLAGHHAMRENSFAKLSGSLKGKRSMDTIGEDDGDVVGAQLMDLDGNGSDNESARTEEPAEDGRTRSVNSVVRRLTLTNAKNPRLHITSAIKVAPLAEQTMDVDEASSSESQATSGDGEFTPAKKAIHRRKTPQSKKAQALQKPRKRTTRPKQSRRSESKQSKKEASRKMSTTGSTKRQRIQVMTLPGSKPATATRIPIDGHMEAKSVTQRSRPRTSRPDHPGCYCDLDLLIDTIECGICRGLFHAPCAGYESLAMEQHDFTCILCRVKGIPANSSIDIDEVDRVVCFLALYRRVLLVVRSAGILETSQKLQNILQYPKEDIDLAIDRLAAEGLVEPDHTVEKLQACRTLDPDAHKVRGQYDDSMEIAPRKWVVGSRTDRKLRMYFEPGGKLECDTFRISSASE